MSDNAAEYGPGGMFADGPNTESSITARQARNKKAEAWVREFVKIEPIRGDLLRTIDDAEAWDALMEVRKVNSLASDGWEMIEAAFREEQADEIS